MDVRMIEKLKDKLCEELENVSRKSQMSGNDLDSIHKLIVSIEKLMKIEEMEGEGEYSHRGGRWDARGSYNNGNNGNSYGNGYNDSSYDNESYANRGQHYVRGHYSRAEGASMVREHIRKMMDENEINGSDRRTLERAMEILG